MGIWLPPFIMVIGVVARRDGELTVIAVQLVIIPSLLPILLMSCIYNKNSDHLSFFSFFFVSSDRPSTSMMMATPARIHLRGGWRVFS